MSDEALGARKPRKTKEEVYKHIQETEMEDTQALKVLRNELPWKDWILTDFLRYWYWLGVFALDIFLVLELTRRYHVDDALGAALLAAVFLAIAGIAFMGYHKVWIEGPFTKAEAVKRVPGKLMKRRRFS